MQLNNRNNDEYWYNLILTILSEIKTSLYTKEIHEKLSEYGYKNSKETVRTKLNFLHIKGQIKPTLKKGRQAWILTLSTNEDNKSYKIDYKMIDLAIAKIIIKEKKIPLLEEIAIYIGKNWQNSKVQDLIFERLAIIQRQEKNINKNIKNLYHKKVKDFGKTRKYQEEKCIPTNQELIKKLNLGESELSNPALINLIDLCLNNFKDEQIKLV